MDWGVRQSHSERDDKDGGSQRVHIYARGRLSQHTRTLTETLEHECSKCYRGGSLLRI